MKELKILRDNYSDESGIAIVIALVMLLVMSIMAISISFLSNTDFQTMSNFKRGQEAFLAAESCVQETRRQISEEGLAFLLFKQSAQDPDAFLVNPLDIDLASSNTNLIKDSNGIGATCRSGNRIMEGVKGDGTVVPSKDRDLIFTFPEGAKSASRDLRGFSKDIGDPAGAQATTLIFTVIGKDSQDKDKDDGDLELNTGTLIAVGIEVIGGGATNVY